MEGDAMSTQQEREFVEGAARAAAQKAECVAGSCNEFGHSVRWSPLDAQGRPTFTHDKCEDAMHTLLWLVVRCALWLAAVCFCGGKR